MSAMRAKMGAGSGWALVLVVVAATFVGGSGTASATTRFRLTPQTLVDLVECRASHDVLADTGARLFAGRKPPPWMRALHRDGHDGMIGLVTFRLSKPVTVFGAPVDRISFLKEWVVIERPRDAALATVAAERLRRAPIQLTEQYYRFVDPEDGPMLGAFVPADDMFAVLLGGDAEREDPGSLFLGCRYAAASEAEFLEAARKADGIGRKAATDIKRMLQGQP